MGSIQNIAEKYAKRFRAHIHPPVWFGAAGLILAFVLFGTTWTDVAATVFQQIQSFIVTTMGWFYILTATVLLGVIVWLWFSRFAYIRLGAPDDEPSFGYFKWFSMLFAAGMGIGLVFFGVSEPIMHYMEAPLATGGTGEKVNTALRISFFHWGLHPWAIYVLFALLLAYLHFRHGLPLAPRTMLYPIIGDRIYGWLGHLIDIMATVGTLFGVATSLGFGAMQINTGIAQLIDVPHNVNVQILLITIITLIATTSVVLGLHAGISRLSLFNIALAAVLFVFVLIAGPTLYLIELFVSSLGDYIQHLPQTSLWMELEPGADWQKNWTLFYWSWWISWSPFVGVFIARISRGRTVREFITGVLLIPSIAAFFWLAVLGGSGLHMHLYEGSEIAQVIQDDVSLSLHALFGNLPFSDITTVLATLLVTIFFITSSDSGSFVVDMITSGGDPNPTRSQRIFWALSEGAVAITLLAAGGLQALRTASLLSGVPMAIILLLSAYGIIKALKVDHHHPDIPEVHQLYKEKITSGNKNSSKISKD